MQDEGRLPAIVREAERTGQLAVAESYETIQGESSAVGLPGLIVRLAGCPLRCAWCDTVSAYEGGELRSVDEIVDEARRTALPSVLVTGGEPLAQSACRPLLARLADVAPLVLLETSGALDIRGVDPRVRRIVDAKPPSSSECHPPLPANRDDLRPHDEVKFVVADRRDYLWARERIQEDGLAARCGLLMGAVSGRIEPATLVSWILEDRLPVRFQLQLHKVIWGPEATGR